MGPFSGLILATTLAAFMHGSQMFNVMASENSGSEFNLEIDEVFLTDLQAEKVETQHLMPGKSKLL